MNRLVNMAEGSLRKQVMTFWKIRVTTFMMLVAVPGMAIWAWLLHFQMAAFTTAGTV